MSNIILSVKNIKMIKGKRLILNVPALDIMEGEVLSLMGHNGAGKSTLLQVMALLQRPTEGQVFFCRQAVPRSNTLYVRRQMASVLQDPLLLDTTVFKNVAVGLQIRKVPKSEINRKVMPWLKRLGIDHLANNSIRNLSGGEAQRVSLARALVLEPRVLFLDEPFSALDTPTRKAILSDLKEILQEKNITAVFITHDYREIPQLAQRVVELKEGHVIRMGRPDDILGYESPL
ncbi:ABC transporter ATP-binding protein [Desulfofalx alkaliphila]|uniref:ABC transporter ATP-binding protein n=1 Tax=Desulfofalx alkaliphila TaxID=105483 RepID=UPI00068D0C68|nr:ABC transporter ATP-binding protein [Desulfofalx alkaliphila]